PLRQARCGDDSGERAREGVDAEREQQHADDPTKDRIAHSPERPSSKQRSSDRTDGEKHDQRPVRREIGSLRGQIHGYAGTVDDERHRGRRRNEGFFLYVEPEKRGGADPALISDEPTEKPGQRAADERRAPPGKAHPLREAGEAPDR